MMGEREPLFEKSGSLSPMPPILPQYFGTKDKKYTGGAFMLRPFVIGTYPFSASIILS